jgi:hypothetical protein
MTWLEAVVGRQQWNEVFRPDTLCYVFAHPELISRHGIKPVVAVDLAELHFFLVGVRILEVPVESHVPSELALHTDPLNSGCCPFEHVVSHAEHGSPLIVIVVAGHCEPDAGLTDET